MACWRGEEKETRWTPPAGIIHRILRSGYHLSGPRRSSFEGRKWLRWNERWILNPHGWIILCFGVFWWMTGDCRRGNEISRSRKLINYAEEVSWINNWWEVIVRWKMNFLRRRLRFWGNRLWKKKWSKNVPRELFWRYSFLGICVINFARVMHSYVLVI